MLLASIGDSVERGLNEFFVWLPKFAAFVVILIIGYIVAKVLAGVIGRVLQRTGLDRTLHEGQAGQWVQKVTSSPSRLIGRISFWAVFLGAISLAVSVLGIDALEDFVAAIYAYLPNVIAAFLIFLVAGLVAGAVAGLVARTMGDTATGKVIATVVPILIMAIAGFMILDQLMIAPEIVTITYAALMGGTALAMALAFGLGGRDVASQMLQGAYIRGQQSKEQVKQDLQQGKERTTQDAERLKAKAENGEGPEPAGVEAEERPRTSVA